MGMDVTVNGWTVLRAAHPQLHLQRIAGAHELVLRFEAQIIPAERTPRNLAIYGAKISMQGNGGSLDLGYARLDAPFHAKQGLREMGATLTFALPLHPPQLSAIEELRAESDLSLYLAPCGIGGDGSVTNPLYEKWGIPVPRSRWLEMLRDARALDVLLLEIPMPVGEVPAWAKAVRDDLTRAQRHFHMGEYVDCVGSCRRVLDELGKRSHGDRWSGPLLGSLANRDTRDAMTKQEREQAIQATIRHFTHLAHHSESDGGVFYDRAEAKLALSLTAAITARMIH